MQKEIKIRNRGIPYHLKISRRARRVRLSVAHDSSVVLTVPWRADIRRAEDFLKAKTNWVIKKLDFFKQYKGKVVLKSGKREYLKYKNQALVLAGERANYWNQFYNFSFKKINIKNQKTRWGSASKKGNLNFNYKIVHLPKELLDYLVAHELCHFKEFNHSKKFWDLVSRTIPNYKLCRARLKSMIF